MADSRITGLVELAATPDPSDVLAIVDLDGGAGGIPKTKKITVANLGGGGPGGVLPAGTIANSGLKWDGVSAWVEETQIALVGGVAGIEVRDVTLANFIRMGHNGATATFSVDAATTEVIFGLGGGPTTAWRFEEMVRVPDGSAALPGITFFGGGLTTGWFRNVFGLSASITTVEQLRISNATTEIYSDRFILAPNIGTDRITLAVSPPTDANDFVMTGTSLTDFHVRGTGMERFVLEELNLAMIEKSAAPGDVAGVGQFWVRDDVPNVAMFTDDAGTDFVLNGAAVIPDPLLLSAGSAAAPTYSFVLSPSSGLFTVSANRPGISSSGLLAQDWQTIASHAITTSETDIIAASTTQTQGNGQLLSSYNVVTPVANANDVSTMPTASAGKRVVVINSGANVLQLFPSLGDDLGAGVNASITIPVAGGKTFLAEDGVTWATSGEAGIGGGGASGTVTNSILRFDGAAFVETTQYRATLGATGFQIFDAGLTDNISIGHNGSIGLINTVGSTEVVFGLTSGPSTGWRFEQLIRVPDGSAAAPSATFFGSITTGFFRGALGLSHSVAGVEQFRVSNATTQVFSDDFRLVPNIGADSLIIRVNPVTDANDLLFTLGSLVDVHWRGTGGERFVLEEYNLAMFEKSAAPGDVAGTAQFWIRDDAPNTAMFTNDAGVDKSLVNDSVQARRTTDYTLTTAFADVTLDTTDVETDSAVLNHDLAGSTDNIIVGQPGTYEITYGADIDPLASGNENIRCFGRFRLNDAGVDIPGSLASTSSFEDGSVDGDFVFFRLQCSFIVTLAAGDFLTLQLMKVELTAAGTFTAEEVTVTVKRLL